MKKLISAFILRNAVRVFTDEMIQHQSSPRESRGLCCLLLPLLVFVTLTLFGLKNLCKEQRFNFLLDFSRLVQGCALAPADGCSVLHYYSINVVPQTPVKKVWFVCVLDRGSLRKRLWQFPQRNFTFYF